MLNVTSGKYLHIFLVLSIEELNGKGFIRVAHMHSFSISFRDYVFSSGASKQILQVVEKVRKKMEKNKNAGRVTCIPLDSCSMQRCDKSLGE